MVRLVVMENTSPVSVLLRSLLAAETSDERRALMVAATRVNSGRSSQDCVEQADHIFQDDVCLLCGRKWGSTQ